MPARQGAELGGVPGRSSWGPIAARLTGRGEEIEKLIGSLVVDTSRISTELSWRPPVSMRDGLAETARWFTSERGASAPARVRSR